MCHSKFSFQFTFECIKSVETNELNQGKREKNLFPLPQAPYKESAFRKGQRVVRGTH